MAPTPRIEPADSEVSAGGLWPVWEFAVHVVVGSLIFLVIAGEAIGLDSLTRSAEQFGIDPFIRGALKLGEYAVIVTDVILFIVFLFKAAVRAARRF